MAIKLIAIAGWCVAGIFMLFWKSFLPSYLKKKGENLATKEDFNELKSQCNPVTGSRSPA